MSPVASIRTAQSRPRGTSTPAPGLRLEGGPSGAGSIETGQAVELEARLGLLRRRYRRHQKHKRYAANAHCSSEPVADANRGLETRVEAHPYIGRDEQAFGQEEPYAATPRDRDSRTPFPLQLVVLSGGPLIDSQSEPGPAAQIRLDAPFRPRPVLEDGGDQNPSPFVIVPPLDLAVQEVETDSQPPTLLDA